MQDRLQTVRRKSRFIVEIRYETIPQVLDLRGALTAAVHPEVTGKLEHWGLHPDRIVFTDSAERPTIEYAVGIQRLTVVMEDPPGLPHFFAQANKFIAKVYGEIGGWMPKAERIGVRFITVQQSPDPTFDAIRDRIVGLFHRNPLKVPIKIADTQAVIVHEHGRFNVGPTKKDDEWVKVMFKSPDVNIPDVGVAVDIDSFVKGWPVKDRAALIAGVKNVAALTTSMEEDIARAVGTIDG